MIDPTEAALDALLAGPTVEPAPKKRGRKPKQEVLAPEPAGPTAMPEIPEGYFDRAVEASHTAVAARASGETSRAERLECIVDQAMGKMEEILSIQADPYDREGLKLLSIQKDVISSVTSLAVKVDENHFRKRSASALVAILAKITAEERQPLAAE